MNSKESPADFPAGLLPGETLMKNPMYVRAGIAGNQVRPDRLIRRLLQRSVYGMRRPGAVRFRRADLGFHSVDLLIHRRLPLCFHHFAVRAAA